MKSVAMFGRVGSTLRQAQLLRVQARRCGHHDAPVNPGPPITFDYSPVPCQPYQQIYGQLQSKFNTYLAISAVMFVGSFTLALLDDVFAVETMRPPKSYKNKEPVLIKS
ncbi:Deltameth-res domain-containing protein [Aphelenchoides besseyi]|nr:Deltameth-res domain-containing protein [Aphelenchoides besseyi]KAI6201347.1 Deltameth-res domain-containing protein [Aphelenchoides besseyi]